MFGFNHNLFGKHRFDNVFTFTTRDITFHYFFYSACDKLGCVECGKIDKCDPFEEKLKRLEQRDRMLRSMGL